MNDLLSRVRDNPYIPPALAKHETGVQQSLDPVDANLARYAWLQARNASLKAAHELALIGGMDEVVSKLLEPFLNEQL